jgi:hypothetical protein
MIIHNSTSSEKASESPSFYGVFFDWNNGVETKLSFLGLFSTFEKARTHAESFFSDKEIYKAWPNSKWFWHENYQGNEALYWSVNGKEIEYPDEEYVIKIVTLDEGYF